ncbi:MAG TPA: xanthine dehydrogenase small subunit [Woeseiaceae bacterium]|nr:xanthine dehydrogenase small subunit [Woeseiaceae bacterium]
MPGPATNDRAARSIRFLLDGEIVTVDNPDPTRTVLQYLREDLRRTGTKEGCAEGDCGACTVVVGTPAGEGLELRAVNACIRFLPTLDGTELFTVESLADAAGLHPVQRAMVEAHASQCGFCTPGFVMSLFALYKNPAFNAVDRPGRRDIDEALAGNLCRCTGYRPIVAAAQAMYDGAGEGDDAGNASGNASGDHPGDNSGAWLRAPGNTCPLPPGRARRLEALARRAPLDIRHGQRRFTAPTSLDGLAAALAERPGATLLAGGTDVGLWVTKALRELDDIVYVGRVPELKRLAVAGDALEIGAGVSLADSVPALVARYPGLEEMFARFASPPIRNAGTLGGNLANGSPIGDALPALMVLGTTLVLCSAAGRREVALDAFYPEYGRTARRRGEFLEAIRVPLPAPDPPGGQRLVRCYKVSKRFDQDISAVCAAFHVLVADGTVVSATVAFGGMAATVRRALHCEAALTGAPWSRATIDEAAQVLGRDYEPISDMRATAAYRLRVAQNLLRRLHAESATGAAPGPGVRAYGRAG